jgi:flagellum-specific ATP synthase
MSVFHEEIEKVQHWEGLKVSGRVTQVIGLLIESVGPTVSLGELCHVYNKYGDMVPCEVVGFKENKVLLMSLGVMDHISPGSEVYPVGKSHKVPVGRGMCGRVIDALGNPLDGKGPIIADAYYPVMAPPPQALHRTRIEEPMALGIKALDGLCTVGRGQRLGIFSGSGVGKSVLLGMMAKMAKADVNVIALIGERGREVREFIDKNLGPEGLKRSVVVVVTSDQEALLRSKGANVAMAVAEFFRDEGLEVLFMMDSVTRYAMALREIGLAVGEPPTTRGYTPSVFAHMPKLLERAGTSDKGSITGIFTILVEGDDLNDPVADTVRSIIDGHIILSRKMASSNHYPAIDVLQSLSRVMTDVVDLEHYNVASKFRDMLQVYRDAEDLINIGAYAAGSNPKIDRALSLVDKMTGFLRQDFFEFVEYDETKRLMKAIIES